MEQARYWMWMKRKHDLNTRSSFGDMREEEAFAEDVAGCIWPPRCYSCTFCKREFKSAQALGGHMNVHRKDRAILKFSPNLDHSPKLVPFPNHFLSPQNSPSNSNLLKGQSGVWNHPAYTGSDEGPILNHLAYTSSEEWSTLNKRQSGVLNHPAYTRSDEGPILNKIQSGVLNHQVYTRSDEGPILNKRQYGVSNLPAYTRLDEGSSILNKRQSGVLSHREYTISNAEMLGHLQTFDQNSDSNQEILSTSPLSLTRVSSIGENHPTETLPRESGSFFVGKQGYFTVSDPRYNETTSPKISYLKSSFSKKDEYYDEEADDLSVNLSFLVYPSSQEINGSIIADEMIQSCKRQRLNDGNDEPPFTYSMSWNSGSDKDRCRLVGVDEPLKVMSPNPHLEEDLDLELRLGDPPKVKY